MPHTNCLMLFITLCICFKSAYSKPTFTNEYVHIKLHVPEQTGEELLKNIQEVEHHAVAAPVAYHKVIHHYHKRRRPNIKHNYVKFANEAALIESIDHNVKDNYKAVKNIETYVVKHTPKIKQNVKTLKIIEEKLPQHHEETFKVIKPYEQTETFKIIEEKIPTKDHHHHDHHHHQQQQHIETFKVWNNIQHNQNPYDYQHDNTINTETYKILNEHKNEEDYDYHHHHHQHYNSRPTYAENAELLETELRPPPQFLSRPTQVEKLPYLDYSKQNRPVIKTETIEVTKPKMPYQHITQDNSDSYTTIPEENPTYTTSAGYKYKQPSVYNYKENIDVIAQKPAEAVFYPTNTVNPLRIPSSKYQHQTHETIFNYQNEAVNRPGNQYDFARDEDLLSEILDATKNNNPSGYKYQPTQVNQNFGSSDVVDWPTDNEDAVINDNRSAAETYRGVDSYSVNHVQGVGSGGYHYHSPFLKK